MNLQELQDVLPSLSDGDIAKLKDSINDAQAARIAARNAALPEFPWVVAVEGHSVPTQVSKARAVELLAAGSHFLANPEGQQ